MCIYIITVLSVTEYTPFESKILINNISMNTQKHFPKMWQD